MEKYQIEYQFKLYLQRVGLAGKVLHPEQDKQLRQAFYGAFGQLLFLMRDDVSELDEDAAIAVLEDLKKQVGEFFLRENSRSN